MKKLEYKAFLSYSSQFTFEYESLIILIKENRKKNNNIKIKYKF